MAKLTDIQKAKVEDCYNDLMQLSSRLEILNTTIDNKVLDTSLDHIFSALDEINTLIEE